MAIGTFLLAGLASLLFLCFLGGRKVCFYFCFVLGVWVLGFFLVDKKSRCHCHIQAKPPLQVRETIVKGHFMYQGETSVVFNILTRGSRGTGMDLFTLVTVTELE